MKLVYTHPNSMVVGTMASLLAQAGIETEYRNELLGGAVGEIAPGETWVELWVIDDGDADEGTRLIEGAMEAHMGDDWLCGRCEESNP
ncbi:MAG: DUF2007 domain-containing protein, partial [Proteobacteria bacterium]|nr:DUF2007 domain-containing protein [Pseudomonadota bacterium]